MFQAVVDLEPKYTFHPRFFAALRYEQNDYPSLAPRFSSTTNWRSNGVIFKDVDAGGGFRVTATSLLKVTVRADRWTPNISPNAPKDNGYAVVAQWSQTFDLVDLATRRR